MKDFVVVITRRVKAESVADAVHVALEGTDPATRVSVWKAPNNIDEADARLWRGTLADVDKIKD